MFCRVEFSRIRRRRILRRRSGAPAFALFFTAAGTGAADAAGVEVAVHEKLASLVDGAVRVARELDDEVVHAFQNHVHGAEAGAEVGGPGLARGAGACGRANDGVVSGSVTVQGKKVLHGLMDGL